MTAKTGLTQKQEILKWLNEHGSLTRLQAILNLGIIELPARICELERDGYDIPRSKYSGTAKNGRTYTSARYFRPLELADYER